MPNLEEMRYGTEEEAVPGRKKRRLDVEPGKSIKGAVHDRSTNVTTLEPSTSEEQLEQGNVSEADSNASDIDEKV